jgi:hypothetical protein
MPSPVNARLAIGLFACLLVISVWLKMLRGPQIVEPSQSAPGLLEIRIVRNLQSQGFSTQQEVTPLHGTIIFANKDRCRLSVRDASHGEWEKGIYERDAAPIGPVRYLIAGRSYHSPPTIPILIGRLEATLMRGLHLSGSAPIALALAASPACRGSEFGLSNSQVPV